MFVPGETVIIFTINRDIVGCLMAVLRAEGLRHILCNLALVLKKRNRAINKVNETQKIVTVSSWTVCTVELKEYRAES